MTTEYTFVNNGEKEDNKWIYNNKGHVNNRVHGINNKVHGINNKVHGTNIRHNIVRNNIRRHVVEDDVEIHNDKNVTYGLNSWHGIYNYIYKVQRNIVGKDIDIATRIINFVMGTLGIDFDVLSFLIYTTRQIGNVNIRSNILNGTPENVA